MKRNLFIILCLACLLPLCSCENDVLVNTSSTQENMVNRSFDFIYKGQHYSSEYTVVNKVKVLKDEQVAKLWNKLQDQSNLVAFLRADGKLEYFDNMNDFELNLDKIKLINTLNTITDISVIFYKNSQFGGASKSFSYNTNNNLLYTFDSFIGTGFNDEISSLKYSCSYTIYNNSMNRRRNFAILYLYENEHYSGYVLTAEVQPIAGRNIGDIPRLEDFFRYGREDWNDIISSFRIECLTTDN